MEAKLRDEAVEMATSNMVLAKKLEPEYAAAFMVNVAKLSDCELAHVLNGSKILYHKYLREHLSMN